MRNRCVSLLQLQRQLSVTCHLYSQIRTAHHCCSPTEQGRSFLFFSYRYVENITPQGPQQALWLRRLYHLNNCPLRLLHKLTYKLKHAFSNLTSIILTVHTSDRSLKCYNIFSTFLIEILGLRMHQYLYSSEEIRYFLHLNLRSLYTSPQSAPLSLLLPTSRL